MQKEKGPVQKWSVDTKDGFHEKVDKKELLKWGESLSQDDDTTDDFTVTDAINCLKDYGYGVEKLALAKQ